MPKIGSTCSYTSALAWWRRQCGFHCRAVFLEVKRWRKRNSEHEEIDVGVENDNSDNKPSSETWRMHDWRSVKLKASAQLFPIITVIAASE